MKNKLFCLAVLSLLLVSPVFAAYDMYLSISGVAGAPVDTAHKNWMKITEVVDNTLKTSGTVGLVISKTADANSATLYRDCLQGRAYPGVMLDICKDGVLVCKMILNDATVTQIKPQFTKDYPDPQEELTFSCSTINWQFYTTDADGKPVTTQTGWNNLQRKAL